MSPNLRKYAESVARYVRLAETQEEATRAIFDLVEAAHSQGAIRHVMAMVGVKSDDE